jgi:hypothetical protein
VATAGTATFADEAVVEVVVWILPEWNQGTQAPFSAVRMKATCQWKWSGQEPHGTNSHRDVTTNTKTANRYLLVLVEGCWVRALLNGLEQQDLVLNVRLADVLVRLVQLRNSDERCANGNAVGGRLW